PRFPAPDGRVKRLSDDARDALMAHDWPGNVRELQNRVQRATLIAPGPFVTPRDLGLDEASMAPHPVRYVPPLPGSSQPAPDNSDPERREIEDALMTARGVISRAAAGLGLSR